MTVACGLSSRPLAFDSDFFFYVLTTTPLSASHLQDPPPLPARTCSLCLLLVVSGIAVMTNDHTLGGLKQRFYSLIVLEARRSKPVSLG